MDAVVLEKHVTCEEFRQDAAQTPNINLVVIAATKNDFRGSVGARLHVTGQVVMNEA